MKIVDLSPLGKACPLVLMTCLKLTVVFGAQGLRSSWRTTVDAAVLYTWRRRRLRH